MSSSTTAALALSLNGLSKSYPGVQALRDVTVSLARGRVLAVVGENGAGKSTLMKSIAGAVSPSSGTIEVLGTPLFGGSPRAAEEAGVAMIYQELTLAPDMTAEENVFLGHLPSRLGVVRRREVRRRYLAVASRVGADINPEARAGKLSTANQQLLEIMRALVHDRKLVIMDEPTASLGPEDIRRLHGIIRELKRDGRSVLYVSHDLEAVIDISDEVLVMREGRTVAHRPTEEWSLPQLVTAMLGHTPAAPSARPKREATDTPAYEIRQLSAPGVDVPYLRLDQGEVVGIAGLVGSGRTRMLRAIAGADLARTGQIQIAGAPGLWPRTPAQGWKRGIALAPEDRKHQGLVLHRSSGWNVALGAFRLARARGGVTEGSIRKFAAPFAQRVSFAPERLAAPAGTLSGGNQQKLMLARLLSRPIRLMLLDEPTRGMDIGAKAEVFTAMSSFARSGGTVLWSSSELQEVLDHSDRILVVSNGRLVGEYPHGAAMHDILAAAFGTTTISTLPNAEFGRTRKTSDSPTNTEDN